MKTLVKRGQAKTSVLVPVRGSALVNALAKPRPTARTANGALTHSSTGSKLVDMFALAGAFRKQAVSDDASVLTLFQSALAEDKVMALKILFWARDVRGGAGERRFFQICWNWFSMNYIEDARRLLPLLPFFGRWKDVWESTADSLDKEVLALVKEGLDNGDGLLAKWLPRQGAMAKFFSNGYGMSSKNWRKKIVSLSSTVEQLMCANNFGEINYSQVPSVAFKNYTKAFARRDTERFNKFIASAMKGEVKINAGAIYPHDLVQKVWNSSDQSADAQWNNLPDFIAEGKSILPVVDTSVSMMVSVAGKISAMMVSVALGIYCAERNKSVFKNSMITFESRPHFHIMKEGNSLSKNVQEVMRISRGGSTNLQATFQLILDAATRAGLSDSDMPDYVLIISDMEFNLACGGNTNLESIRSKFRAQNYTMPNLVFWNVNGRQGNQAATFDDKSVALISGFSPSIMQSVLSAKTVTPYDIMMNTIMSDRYEVVNL